MFNAGALTFREFVMNEPLPLATIQNAVLEFLRDRDDGVVFGAQIAMLLLTFPELKVPFGPVADSLGAAGAEPEVLAAWHELVAQEIQPPDPDDEF